MTNIIRRLTALLLALSASFAVVQTDAWASALETAPGQSAVTEIIQEESEPEITPLAAASTGLGVTYHKQADIQKFVNDHPGLRTDAFTFATEPSLAEPYSSGTLSQDTLTSALNLLNQCRYIAGLNADVKPDSSYSQQAANAALVSALNGSLSHTPERPSVLKGKKYDALFRNCYNAAANVNLGAGHPTLNLDLVYGWLADNKATNLSTLGHRRWTLNPPMAKAGFGAVRTTTGQHTYYAMYIKDKSGSGTQTKVAWPAQEMPVQYFQQDFPWSVSVGTTVDASKVSITLTRTNDNKVWKLDPASDHVKSVTPLPLDHFLVNNDSYGQTGCIIFLPDLDRLQAGDTYKVNITYNGGTIAYNVRFFELTLPHEHSYENSKPTYKWSNDYKSCVAGLSCDTCGQTVEQDCEVTHHNPESLCVKGGKAKLTADVHFHVNHHSYTQTRTINVAAGSGHHFYYRDDNHLTHTLFCSLCDHQETEAHDYVNGKCKCSKPTSPICDHRYGDPVEIETEDGIMIHHTCEICGELHTDPVITAPHTPVEEHGVAPTCVKPGLTPLVYCVTCHTILAHQDEIPATGKHSYTRGHAVAATCGKDGRDKEEYCTVCGKVRTAGKVVPATGKHTVAKKKAVAATCAKTGLTEGEYCTVCKLELKPQKKVSATGKHSYTAKVVKPTYGAKGYTLYTCKVCKKSYKDNYTAKLTVPATALSKVTNAKGAKMTVTWKKNTAVTGYQLQYSTDKSFKKGNKTVNVAKNKTVSSTVSKLTKKKTYYVRIRSYKTVSDTKYYSAWSKSKSVKITK